MLPLPLPLLLLHLQHHQHHHRHCRLLPRIKLTVMPQPLTLTEPCHQPKQRETLTMTTTVMVLMALRCYQVSMYRKTTDNDGNQNKLPSDQQGIVQEPPVRRQKSSVSSVRRWTSDRFARLRHRLGAERRDKVPSTPRLVAMKMKQGEMGETSRSDVGNVCCDIAVLGS